MGQNGGLLNQTAVKSLKLAIKKLLFENLVVIPFILTDPISG
jgi:hypothetical protein